MIRLERRVDRGAAIAVPRASLPALEEDEYYAFQLVGLDVEEEGGRQVGSVTDVLEYPANDVLELDSGLLAPARRGLCPEGGSRQGRIVSRRLRRTANENRRLHTCPARLRVAHRAAADRGRPRDELELRLFNYRDTRRCAPARSTTSRTAAARAWCCASTSSPPRSTRSTARARRSAWSRSRRRGARSRRRSSRSLRADELTLLSARFEGFDERIVEHLATDAISIGPYVLSNGDLPAMVLLDAIARRLPGALAEGSGELESFSDELGGGLEYPHYTRPAEFRGLGRARRAPLRRPRADRRLAARETCDERPARPFLPGAAARRARRARLVFTIAGAV